MYTFHRAVGARRLTLAAALSLPLLVAPGLAQADGHDLTLKTTPGLGSPAPSGTTKSPQQLRLEARNVSMQLGRIQQQTLADSSDLQHRQKQFSEHMAKVMRQNGHHPDADKKQLLAIMKKLRGNADMKKSERIALLKQFSTIRTRLQQAQIEALRADKSLEQQRRDLSRATFIAMKRTHPETDKLIARLRQIQQQLQAQSMSSLSK